MNPKYFILAVLSTAAYVLMTGCSASEEITTVPKLTSFSHSDCKRYYSPQNIDGRATAQTRSEEEPPILSLSYSVEGGKLDLHFENIEQTCDIASVKFIAKVEGGVISIGYASGYEFFADCICAYDLDCGLEQLSPGKYTLNIYCLGEYLLGDEPDMSGFPYDPNKAVLSEEVDLTKDISISFPYGY